MHLIFSKASFRTSRVNRDTGKAMTGKWVLQVHMQRGIFFALKRRGQNCFTNFIPRASQTGLMMGYAGSMRNIHDICLTLLCQSIAINEQFFVLLSTDRYQSIPIN